MFILVFRVNVYHYIYISASSNQRDTKEKQIVMGLASIKFRQPTEISYGKKMREKEKGVRIIAHVYQ